MKEVALVLVSILALSALVTCVRDDGQPDPAPQELVPCDPSAGSDDPLACPPVDAGLDAGVDAPPGVQPETVH